MKSQCLLYDSCILIVCARGRYMEMSIFMSYVSFYSSFSFGFVLYYRFSQSLGHVICRNRNTILSNIFTHSIYYDIFTYMHMHNKSTGNTLLTHVFQHTPFHWLKFKWDPLKNVAHTQIGQAYMNFNQKERCRKVCCQHFST